MQLQVYRQTQCYSVIVLIHKLADEEYCHLVFMRSMVIRWNTMYVEMQRARNL
jgi:hypothetical protein